MYGEHTWKGIFYWLALGTAMLVMLFSVYNKYSFLVISLRTIIGFLIIYFLGIVLHHIWNIMDVTQNPPQEQNRIDYILGEIHAPERQERKEQENIFPGQINKEMKDGIPDTDTQVELAKKMGWGETD
ncbi:MAG: hypothetical protein GX207_04445 [Peptococcaceae bacterium]|nr:hypothetical protein [Peptococcaceae bacterium]